VGTRSSSIDLREDVHTSRLQTVYETSLRSDRETLDQSLFVSLILSLMFNVAFMGYYFRAAEEFLTRSALLESSQHGKAAMTRFTGSSPASWSFKKVE